MKENDEIWATGAQAQISQQISVILEFVRNILILLGEKHHMLKEVLTIELTTQPPGEFVSRNLKT